MYSNIFQREFPYHQTCSNGNLTFVSWNIRLIHRLGAYPCNLLESYNPDFLRCNKYAGLYRFFPAFLTLLQKNSNTWIFNKWYWGESKKHLERNRILTGLPFQIQPSWTA